MYLSKMPLLVKVLIALVVDFVDFFMPPGIESLWDIFATAIAYSLVGPLGVAAGLELIEPTGRIDGFLPIVTIIVLGNFVATGT